MIVSRAEALWIIGLSIAVGLLLGIIVTTAAYDIWPVTLSNADRSDEENEK